MWPLEYVIKGAPVPIKPATVILIKVILCNLLLHMLLVQMGNIQKYFTRYQFLIFDTYHPCILCLLQWGSLVTFGSQKGVREQNILRKTELIIFGSAPF